MFTGKVWQQFAFLDSWLAVASNLEAGEVHGAAGAGASAAKGGKAGGLGARNKGAGSSCTCPCT